MQSLLNGGQLVILCIWSEYMQMWCEEGVSIHLEATVSGRLYLIACFDHDQGILRSLSTDILDEFCENYCLTLISGTVTHTHTHTHAHTCPPTQNITTCTHTHHNDMHYHTRRFCCGSQHREQEYNSHLGIWTSLPGIPPQISHRCRV